MDITTDRPAASPLASKAVDTGIIRMKFEMSDCHIHLWIGSTAQWKAGPGAEPHGEKEWPDWAAQHIDLDTDRVAAVKCVLKPESAEKHEAVEGWCSPSPTSVASLRKLRNIILDALEESDHVTRIEMIAGGDGRAQFEVGVVKEPDERGGRWHLLDPDPFVRMMFSDDEDQKW